MRDIDKEEEKREKEMKALMIPTTKNCQKIG